MGSPDENPAVYELAAPANRVDRIERPLLMLHGTSDVNVSYYESVHLADRLLRAGKDFEFVTYPGELPYFHREHVLADAWRRVLETNLAAAMRLIRAADPWLRRAPAGRAVFVTDNPGVRAYWGAYAASKAALEALALAWAAETARTRLRVNLVDPGPMRTALRAEAFPGEDPAALPAPDKAAGLILRLAGPDCRTHGHILRP